MKKFFSLIALASLFVACVPEELDTVFSLKGAKATVEVTVVEINSNQAITTGYTVQKPAQATEVSGNTIVFQAAEDKALEGINDFKVVVSYNGKDYESAQFIHINNLGAGAVAKYSATVVVGEIIPPVIVPPVYDPNKDEIKLVSGAAVVVAGDPVYEAGATHDHAGSKWFANESDFTLIYTTSYPTFTGSEVANLVVKENDFQNLVDTYITPYNVGIKSETTEVVFQIKPWHLFQVVAVKSVNTTSCQLVLKKGETSEEIVLATFDIVSYSSEVDAPQVVIPNHAGHGHEHGHGHGAHGYNANAGGGIIFAE